MIQPSRILVLAPHTDDGELGCGGTISRLYTEGREVWYAAFCLCSGSLPGHLPADTLAMECKKATAILGIPPDRLILFNYEVRQLPQYRQQVLEELLQLNKTIHPDMGSVTSCIGCPPGSSGHSPGRIAGLQEYHICRL